MAYDITTFDDIVTDVMNRARVSVQDASASIRVARLVNARYQDIQLQEDWSWNVDTAVLTMPEAVTSGTLYMTNAATLVTGTGTAFTEDMVDNYAVTLSGIDDIYRISAFATDEIVYLNTPYVGDTATITPYALYQDIFPLADDVDEILRVWHYKPGTGSTAFKEVTPDEMMHAKAVAELNIESEAWFWSQANLRSDGTKAIEIYPYNPRESYLIYYDYTKSVDSLEDSTDEPRIPKKFRSILVYGALADYLESIGQAENAARAESRYQALLQRMVMKDNKRRNRPKLYHSLRGIGPSKGFLQRHSDDYFDKF